MREFGKALADDVEVPLDERDLLFGEPIKLGGRAVKVFEPTTGQAAYLAMILADDASKLVLTGRVFNFVAGLMEGDDQRWLRSLMLDPREPLSPDNLIDLATQIMEEVTGRPTSGPSTSSAQPQTDGPTSTAGSRRATSSRSRSPRPVSAR